MLEVLEKAKKTFVETAHVVVSGFINEEEAVIRYKLCQQCAYFKESLKQCTVCKCFMPLKVHFKGAQCPYKYWTNTYKRGQLR